jgi:hypothetical protein
MSSDKAHDSITLHYINAGVLTPYDASWQAIIRNFFSRFRNNGIVLLNPTTMFPHGGPVTLSRRVCNNLFCFSAILSLLLNVINAIVSSSVLT